MIEGKIVQPISEIASRIKSARKKAGLSQVELAKGIGLTDKSVSAYEQGRSTPPVSKLKQIAQVTQHPLSYFTDPTTDHVTLDTLILSIERELQEIKKLLKLK